jgi:membrane-bound ClpP family serine protease
MTAATLIGSGGVALLLLAFLLNLFGALRTDGYAYTVLNLAGASLAGYSSYLIDFMPFVVLEAVWAGVAAVGLARRALGVAAAPASRRRDDRAGSVA